MALSLVSAYGAARSSHHTNSLASVTACAAKAPRDRRQKRRPLSDELVAQIKRDLALHPRAHVARLYASQGVSWRQVSDIDFEIAYRDVKAAA